VIDKLKIHATPWCPNLPFWAFFASDRALEYRADSIPEDTDILVTHSPPYGVADRCGPKYGAVGLHIGDRSLNAAIERVKPKAVICGHIHEAFGLYPVKGSILYNVAFVNEEYVPMERLVDIEFDD
jgi:Icc-related predicted phosphoesterase